VLRRAFMTVALDLKTRADIAGYGPAGIVLSSGRSVGYHPVRLT
jgi:hypothetical protein